MKINSINYMSLYNRTAVPYPEYKRSMNAAFGHSAVPYPEYAYAYYPQAEQQGSFTKLASKISSLFSPEVTQKSQEIKNDINRIYEKKADYSNNSSNRKIMQYTA